MNTVNTVSSMSPFTKVRPRMAKHSGRWKNVVVATALCVVLMFVWRDRSAEQLLYAKQGGVDMGGKVAKINDLLIDQQLEMIERDLANGEIELVMQKLEKLKSDREDYKRISKKPDDLLEKLGVLLDAKLDALRDEIAPPEIKIKSDSDTILKPHIKPRLDSLGDDLRVSSEMSETQQFYVSLLRTMLESEPLTKLHKRKYGASNDKVFTVPMDREYTGPMLTENFLNDCLKFPKDFVEEMKYSHNKFVSSMPTAYPEGMCSGNGVVINGGREFSWLALLSIRMMRDVGGTLPVEVVIPYPEDYEQELCEQILPSLNAKCVLLADVFGADLLRKLDFKKYQFKALVLLATSFENVLLLDSDNIPLSAITDDIFEQEPFKSTGLVLWPDYWRRMTSPKFYDIANIKVEDSPDRCGVDQYEPLGKYLPRSYNAKEDLPLHDRKGAIPDPSTESGQLLISRKSHFKTLILAFYYNFYGPDQYYPLLTQSRPGEGDKETFAAAATVFGLPFYTVHQRVMANGYWGDDGFHGSGMMQFSPRDDYVHIQEYLYQMRHGELGTWTDKRLVNYINSKTKRPLFLHANFPKLEPFSMIKDGNLKNKAGEHIKMFTAYDLVPPAVETRIWDIMYRYMCAEKVPFKYIKTKFPEIVDKRAEECSEIFDHLTALRSFEKEWLSEHAQNKLKIQ